jgi:hypothetical protein
MPIFLEGFHGLTPRLEISEVPIHETSTKMISKYHHLRQLLSISFIEKVAKGREIPSNELLDLLDAHVDRTRGFKREIQSVKSQIEHARIAFKASEAVYQKDDQVFSLIRKLQMHTYSLLSKLKSYERELPKE